MLAKLSENYIFPPLVLNISGRDYVYVLLQIQHLLYNPRYEEKKGHFVTIGSLLCEIIDILPLST